MRASSTSTVLIVAIAALGAPIHAYADGHAPWADNDGFQVEEGLVDFLNGVGDPSSGQDLWFRPGWGEDDDGDSCYQIEVDDDATEDAQDGNSDPEENTTWIDSDEFIDGMTDGGVAGSLNNLLSNIGLGDIQLPEERCPGNDPEDLVEVVWRSELCPPPAPSPLHMAPENSAMTGMAGYLEIGGDNPALVTCLGEEIVATARYVIHWDDGHTTETQSQGGPYPDGDVRHAYADTGEREIVVEAYWRGEWNGQDLGEVTNPTVDTLPVTVTELQSVRTTSDR